MGTGVVGAVACCGESCVGFVQNTQMPYRIYVLQRVIYISIHVLVKTSEDPTPLPPIQEHKSISTRSPFLFPLKPPIGD
jgi:hypothetical protein